MNKFKKEIEKRRAEIRLGNRNFPKDKMVTLPIDGMQNDLGKLKRIAAFRSFHFLAQVFEEGPWLRLSVNRTDIDKSGDWIDGITWDDLQWVKGQCGFEDCDAVEAYPKSRDVVNVSNMRHLWLLPPGEAFGFFWRNKTQTQQESANGSNDNTNGIDGGKIVPLEQPSGHSGPVSETLDRGGEGQSERPPEDVPVRQDAD